MTATDLTADARTVLRALAELTATGQTPHEHTIMGITGLRIGPVHNAIDELIAAGVLTESPLVEPSRLTAPARALLLTLAMSPDPLTLAALAVAVAELTGVGVAAAADTITRAADAGLVTTHGTSGYYITETGMGAIERDIREGVVATDSPTLRVATMHMRSLVEAADEDGQPLAHAIAATMTA